MHYWLIGKLIDKCLSHHGNSWLFASYRRLLKIKESTKNSLQINFRLSTTATTVYTEDKSGTLISTYTNPFAAGNYTLLCDWRFVTAEEIFKYFSRF